MDVQVFGHPKSRTTRKAQRFFSERRVRVHFVDLRGRGIAPAELRRFVQRFDVDDLVDPTSRSYQRQGLAYLSASADDWIERIVADPSLLRLPLVRRGRDLVVGDDPPAWERLARAAKDG
ncbi:MAG: arsenate reductase [Actinomycetota bacterium]|nr:arsenate reductase [Actinomycetota bacterium]